MKKLLSIVLILLPLWAMSARAQISIDSLTYEISVYGDVILHWTTPQGTIISQYNIYRGTKANNFELIAELHSPSIRQYIDLHQNVVPGTTYYYWLEAIDIQGRTGDQIVRVLVTPPAGGMQFVSIPPTTATAGKDYWYSPLKVDSEPPESIDYTFGGPHPDGMEINSIAGGIFTFIYWRPIRAGQYPITLVATSKITGAIAVQEFTINVATDPGAVRGIVKSLDERPLPGTTVRLFQVQNNMTYETRTDSAGRFFLPTVQAGEVFAYAKPATNDLMPQWYPLGRSMSEVSARTLAAGDTLDYEFYMLASPGTKTAVTGVVTDAVNGTPVAGASVAFVRKNNFIHIGDTSIIADPSFLENFAIDTSVVVDAQGRFSASLPIGQAYYSIVRKFAYYTSFSPDRGLRDETDALESRAFTVREGMGELSYRLIRSDVTTANKIVGTVRNTDNGVNKEAVIILVTPDLQRGAGGGHTYTRISSLTDKNGYFSFDNLGYTSTYSILAIPLERELVPQYYSSTGGTTVASQSEIVTALGTVQNIDFKLQPVTTGGVGTIYGRVQAKTRDGRYSPVPGTLLFARSTTGGDVLGYAISDSTGWYSIVGLPKDTYVITADNMALGALASPATVLDFTSYNLFTASRLVNLTFDVVTGIENAPLPDRVALFQNYPNPFNPATQIEFSVPVESHVTIAVYSAIGREVARLHDGRVAPGLHSLRFDASALPSGQYYYRLQSGSTTITRSMTVMK